MSLSTFLVLIALTFGQIAVLTGTLFVLWACGRIRRVLNEQQLDAPDPRREVAPSEAHATICIPTDQMGEARSSQVTRRSL